MNTRNTLFITVLALGLLAASSFAFAGQGRGCGGGYGSGYNSGNCPAYGGQAAPALTPEKQAAYDKIVQDYSAKTETLRKDMWAAHLELNALSGNANADPNRIRELIASMKDTSTKLDAARDAFDTRVEKEVGLAPNTRLGMGYGRGSGCGYGRNAGRGQGGAGRGQGPCGAGGCPVR